MFRSSGYSFLLLFRALAIDLKKIVKTVDGISCISPLNRNKIKKVEKNQHKFNSNLKIGVRFVMRKNQNSNEKRENETIVFHVFINTVLFIESVTKANFTIFHPYNYEHFVNALNRRA